MIEFPRLFKKTSTGKIQTWEIYVNGTTMYSESGQLEGKKVKSEDTIKEGKNIGRSNETTAAEQAIAEAQSKWTQKKKKGYVESINDAQNDKVSDLIEGGYLPTLAHSFDKREKDIVYPCAAQPKLDGVRSTSDKKLWTRTRKEIIGVPHISKFIVDNKINATFPNLDGELYNHKFKDDFETIIHIVKQKTKPVDNHELVQYHVYDIPSDKPFSERMKDLAKLALMVGKDSPIKVVETVICNNKEELIAYMNKCLEAGYEGAMVRNLAAPYEYKRSKHLQKLKLFEDAEFEIVGVDEGRGKLTGHAGAFFCVKGNKPDLEQLEKELAAFVHNDAQPESEEYKFFKAKLKGKLSDLKKYLTHFEKYNGKILTVQFQGYTNKNKVPRFPVGLRFRETL